MTARYWFNTEQAGAFTGYHRTTVLKACEAGELHGIQRKPKGRWRIHLDCLNAWVSGNACEHQGRRAAS